MIRPPNRSSLSLVTAALIGIAQMYLVTSLWAYIFLQPFPRWLLAHGLKGTALHAVVFLLPLPAPPSQPLKGP